MKTCRNGLHTYTPVPGKKNGCPSCELDRNRRNRAKPVQRAKAVKRAQAWAEAHPAYWLKIGNRLSRYKTAARLRGLSFALDRRLFEDLVTDNCFYCGTPPEPRNGVDRVNSCRGYEEDNVVTACATCQYAKRDLPRDVFESWVRRAAAHQARYA